MNTRSAIKNSIGPVALSVSFNQDASCFSVGLDMGFSVFDSNPCQLRVSREFGAGIGIVQMFGKSNLIGLVGGGTKPNFPQDRVIIWDDAKQKVVLQISAPKNICGVRITKTHIVIILKNSVRAYKFQNPPELWHSFETTENLLGLCCLDSELLAFPGRSPGQVQLVELLTGKVSIIPAHGSPLRALVISQNSQTLATASETGTLIRVFSTQNCARIAELRRGVDQAIIFSLAISPSGHLLAATSDKSTLHIFDIPSPGRLSISDVGSSHRNSCEIFGRAVNLSQVEQETHRKWGILGRIPMLPRLFSDVYSFTSAQFEIGYENINQSPNGHKMSQSVSGVIGWATNTDIIVISAGANCRWEKFVITTGQDGRRHCIRDGWKKYLIES